MGESTLEWTLKATDRLWEPQEPSLRHRLQPLSPLPPEVYLLLGAWDLSIFPALILPEPALSPCPSHLLS
jgi:hypothetical protein